MLLCNRSDSHSLSTMVTLVNKGVQNSIQRWRENNIIGSDDKRMLDGIPVMKLVHEFTTGL